jgi:hypothetical protein
MKSLLNIVDILDVVEIVTQLDLKTKTRDRRLAYSRNVYFKLARVLTSYSLNDIGKLVNRDHCTVIHGIKQFDNGILEDEYYSLYSKLFADLSDIDDEAKLRQIILMPRPQIVKHFEDKINKIHLEYLHKIDKLEEENTKLIENKAILNVCNELSKLSDGDIHIFIETRLKPFISMRKKTELCY